MIETTRNSLPVVTKENLLGAIISATIRQPLRRSVHR